MATILPTGETTFFDQNGNPLAGGTVTFYIPGTTTPKDTWQDADQLILNTNPVVLDSAGRAVIFGSGSYRQVVNDALGNIIWDKTTAEPTAGNTSYGGTSGGTVNAQTLTGGTFDGSDGATIVFVAGLTNTGAMTLSVGGGSPISVLKNGPTGPVNLAAGDITSGNIYSVSYSSANAAFQLLQSIPPVFAIASQPSAEAGTNNTDLMTPLRTKQAREQAREDINSASTTDLGSMSTQSLYVRGLTQINSFGGAIAGTRKTLTFAGSLTLNHSSSLILPNGGSDIVTQENDSCTALSLGSGDWIVTNYQKYAKIDEDVRSAIAGFDAGSVGTYCFAKNTVATARALGQTIAGSNLSSTNGAGSAGGTTLSGTWRCMGLTVSGSTTEGAATLFLRIS